jgi:hypothetical protein
MSGDTCGGQYGLFYTYCKKIVVDHTRVDSDLTNFPLLINLANDDDLKTVANGGRVGDSQGWDIVFKDSNCNTYDHEIEQYDGAAGTYVAWVRIPSLSSDTDTEVYMYYGAGNVLCNPGNPTGVWSSNYQAVYHLSDDFDDSTSNNRDGTNHGATFTASKIGNGALFDPTDGYDYIDIGNWSVSGEDMTMQAWVYPENFGQNDPRIISKANGSSEDNHVFMLSLTNGSSGDNRMRLRIRTADSWWVPDCWPPTCDPGVPGHMEGDTDTHTLTGDSPEGYLPTAQEWYFLVGAYDDDNSDEMLMYRDEAMDAGDRDHGGDLVTNSWDVWIGANPSGSSSGSYSWYGVLDEIRVLNVELSRNWLEAEYRNQNDPGNFYTVTSCFEQTTEVTQEWVEEVQ